MASALQLILNDNDLDMMCRRHLITCARGAGILIVSKGSCIMQGWCCCRFQLILQLKQS